MQKTYLVLDFVTYARPALPYKSRLTFVLQIIHMTNNMEISDLETKDIAALLVPQIVKELKSNSVTYDVS